MNDVAEIGFQSTVALRKIANMNPNKNIWVVRGGQGSGKTTAILLLICDYALKVANKLVYIVSYQKTKMKDTVIRDFVSIMRWRQVYNQESYNETGSFYMFPNGTKLRFIGLDKEDVGQGLRPDLVYINELTKIRKHETVRNIYSRCKGKTIMDYNPAIKFYVDSTIIPKPNADLLTLTYKDNEFCPESEKAEIESYYGLGYNEDGTVKNEYFANLHRVHALGRPGTAIGAILTRYKVIEEVPKEARFLGYGIDYGWSPDPSAGVAVYQYNSTYISDEIFYGMKMTSHDIAQKLYGYGIKRHHKGYADTSENRTTSELKLKYHYKILPANKKEGSTSDSIRLINSHEWLITASSKNLLDEAENWCMNERTNKPMDGNDHCIDAQKYAVLGCIQVKGRSMILRATA